MKATSMLALAFAPVPPRALSFVTAARVTVYTLDGMAVNMRSVGGAFLVAFDAWGRRRTCHHCGCVLSLPRVGRPAVDCHAKPCRDASNKLRRLPLWRGVDVQEAA